MHCFGIKKTSSYIVVVVLLQIPIEVANNIKGVKDLRKKYFANATDGALDKVCIMCCW